MRFAVTGSTGLIGSALVAELRAEGHSVTRLVRSADTRSSAERLIHWNPERGLLEAAPLENHDAVVHLAGESLIGLLGGPEIRGVLGIVFMLSLYTSFSKPGTGVPEVIAMVAGVLLFGVPLLTGYASWFEILLIVLGVLLLALELFVIPGFGVAGLSGIVLVLVGFVLTFAPPEPGGWSVLPRLQGTRDALVQGFVIATIAMVSAAGLWLWLARYLHNIPYMNRLILSTSVGTYAESADLKEAADLAWPAVGAMGRAITPLRPGGVARFFDPVINDERNVDVVSDLGLVTTGSSVVVRAKEGKRIVVRPAPASGLTV